MNKVEATFVSATGQQLSRLQGGKPFWPLCLLLLALVACRPDAGMPLPTLATTAVAAADALATADPPTATLPPPPPTATVPATATLPATQMPLPTDTATATPTATSTSSPTPSPTATSTPLPTATDTPTPVPTPMATATPLPPPPPPPAVNASPGNPQPYLSRYRLVTFYGSPLGRGLGILGNSPRNVMLNQLRQVAAQYQPLSDRYVMPTYHMVTTVANQSPPVYSHQVGLGVLEEWVASATAGNAAVILDIQPGQADLMTEVNRLLGLLRNPHVHLAIDPEFLVSGEQVPGVQIGHITAQQINEVQAVLDQLALEVGVNRVLIVHQFKDSMIEDKAAIINYPHVELVIDADGAFNANVKIYSYGQYAGEPGFEYGGVKIFYEHDDRILSADEVMGLFPQPSVIVYQ